MVKVPIKICPIAALLKAQKPNAPDPPINPLNPIIKLQVKSKPLLAKITNLTKLAETPNPTKLKEQNNIHPILIDLKDPRPLTILDLDSGQQGKTGRGLKAALSVLVQYEEGTGDEGIDGRQV